MAALVIDRTVGVMSVYGDGVLVAAADVSTEYGDPPQQLRLGSDWEYLHQLYGAVDEVRFTNGARDDAWIAFQAAAMNDTVVTYADEAQP
jgi:hypothetical protein